MDTKPQWEFKASEITVQDLQLQRYHSGLKLLWSDIQNALTKAIEKHPKSYASAAEGAWIVQGEFEELKREFHGREYDYKRVQSELIDIIVVCIRMLIDTYVVSEEYVESTTHD